MTARWTFLGIGLRDDMPERWPERIPLRELGDEGVYVERARTAEQVPVPKCRCTHLKGQHGADRRGRPTCFGSSVCACAEYEEKTK